MQRSCRACRLRKRACDKAKPTCSACSKSGLLCEGYADPESKLFVNFTAENVRQKKKRVLCEAIRKRNSSQSEVLSVINRYYDERPHQSLPADHVRTSTLYCLDMPKEKFDEHVVLLWDHFEHTHSRSCDAWAPAYSALTLQDTSLDLALMSLSALRLALASGDSRAKVFSYSAYEESLKLFRKLCRDLEGGDSPLLAVIALVYTLIEAVQESPDTIFKSGLVRDNAHLRGCVCFLQRCGPTGFQTGGFHRAFKKIRDLVVLWSMSNYQPCLLATPEWLKTPWLQNPKSRRDRFYEIATKLTFPVSEILAPWANGPASAEAAPLSESVISACNDLRQQLEDWARAWYADRGIEWDGEAEKPIVDVGSLGPDVGFVQVELWAVQLIMALLEQEKLKRLQGDKDTESEHTEVKIGALDQKQREASWLAGNIRYAVSLPLYASGAKQKRGLVEGQCRALLPVWSLMEYNRLCPIDRRVCMDDQ